MAIPPSTKLLGILATNVMNKWSVVVIVVLAIALMYFIFTTLGSGGTAAPSGYSTANYISGGCGR